MRLRAFQAAANQTSQALYAAAGLNRTDGRCLDILSQRGGRLPVGELAVAVGVTTSAATTAIDRLERLRHVRRVADPADRRRVLVELEPEHDLEHLEPLRGLGELFAEHNARHTDDELELIAAFLDDATEVMTQYAELLADARESQAGPR